MRASRSNQSVRIQLAALLGIVPMLAGCAPLVAVGVRVLYRRAELSAAQIHTDIPYAAQAGSEGRSHRLDLYLPSGRDWPLILFVHGGNWDAGDKNTRVGGADVYGNIGRFYASRGFGVAVVNYRLQPDTDWRGQILDVRAAVQWACDSISAYGGRTDALFLMGHSAGTHLCSHVAFGADTALQRRLRGVIAVSGAALDLVDPLTWELGEDPAFYAQRFQGEDRTGKWRTDASAIAQLGHSAPAFLILHAGGEKPALKRQSQLLLHALNRAGTPCTLVVVPGQSHSRIVLALSRPDRTAGPAIEAFVRRNTPPG